MFPAHWYSGRRSREKFLCNGHTNEKRNVNEYGTAQGAIEEQKDGAMLNSYWLSHGIRR
jgi:hypothetical protein